jgi:LAGLIDADG DNA endonuclease family
MTKAIPRESKRITYSSEIRALKLLPFSSRQKSIIQGSLLGDGCLHAGWPGTSVNYVFAKTHSVKQSEYVDWICAELKPFVLKKPYLYEPIQSLKLRTISHSDLTELRSVFYCNGKKRLPETIDSIISDPLAVAVWFMDDGNARLWNGEFMGFNLNTQSFTFEENRQIAQSFRLIHGIEPVIVKNNGYFRLSIGKQESSQRFRKLIEAHIIPSMTYKLG